MTLRFDVMQGVRIDYALLSPALLQHVVSCEVISTLPPKWSDHAAVLLELADIPAVPKHPPCALSSKRINRFQQPKTSVAALFAKKRAAQTAAAAPAGSEANAGEAVSASKRLRAAVGVGGPDAASPSNGVQHGSQGEALPEEGGGRGAEKVAGRGSDAVSADEQQGRRMGGAADVPGSSTRDGVKSREPCTGDTGTGRVEEGKRSGVADTKQSRGLPAVGSRRLASTKLSGNQQRSIRAFFSAGNKS